VTDGHGGIGECFGVASRLEHPIDAEVRARIAKVRM
jgi:hypothetical protein